MLLKKVKLIWSHLKGKQMKPDTIVEGDAYEYWKIATDRVNGITADERKKIGEGQIKLF